MGSLGWVLMIPLSVPGDSSKACFVSWQSYPSRARFYFSQRVFSEARSLLTVRIAKYEQAQCMCLMLSVYFTVVLLLLDEFSYKI